jgi:hypothetical protein
MSIRPHIEKIPKNANIRPHIKNFPRSSKIAQLRAADQSIEEYIVETPDPKNQFPAFLDIIEGKEWRVCESNYLFFWNLFDELHAWDHCWRLRVTFGGEPIISEETPLDPELLTDKSEQSIKLLAFNFWKLTREQFRQIPLTTISQILSHQTLLITSEDLLYEFISNEIPTNSDYFV